MATDGEAQIGVVVKSIVNDDENEAIADEIATADEVAHSAAGRNALGEPHADTMAAETQAIADAEKNEADRKHAEAEQDLADAHDELGGKLARLVCYLKDTLRAAEVYEVFVVLLFNLELAGHLPHVL